MRAVLHRTSPLDLPLRAHGSSIREQAFATSTSESLLGERQATQALQHSPAMRGSADGTSIGVPPQGFDPIATCHALLDLVELPRGWEGHRMILTPASPIPVTCAPTGPPTGTRPGRSNISTPEARFQGGREVLARVLACEQGTSTLILTNPTTGRRQALPYRCFSWRCERCRDQAAWHDAKRVIAGIRSEDQWLFLVLTTTWTDEGRFRRGPKTWNRLATKLRREYPHLKFVLVWEVTRSGRLHANLLMHSTELLEEITSNEKRFMRKFGAWACRAGFGWKVGSSGYGLRVPRASHQRVARYITKAHGGGPSCDDDDQPESEYDEYGRYGAVRRNKRRDHDLRAAEYDEYGRPRAARRDKGRAHDQPESGEKATPTAETGDWLDEWAPEWKRRTCQLPLDAPPGFHRMTSSRGLLPPQEPCGEKGEVVREPVERVEARLAMENAWRSLRTEIDTIARGLARCPEHRLRSAFDRLAAQQSSDDLVLLPSVLDDLAHKVSPDDLADLLERVAVRNGMLQRGLYDYHRAEMLAREYARVEMVARGDGPPFLPDQEDKIVGEYLYEWQDWVTDRCERERREAPWPRRAIRWLAGLARRALYLVVPSRDPERAISYVDNDDARFGHLGESSPSPKRRDWRSAASQVIRWARAAGIL